MDTKTIITGYSSGLGKALAEHYLQAGCSVLGLARRQVCLRPSEKLVREPIDLGDTAALCAWLAGGALEQFVADAAEIVLINNAAAVAPNAVAGRQQAAEIAAAVPLNITAPMLLANHLIACKPGQAVLKIAHIGSGAGRTAYPGWSVYGAAKAALDHHARCIAAERHPRVYIASVAPGVVDTDMQREIRRAHEADFPMVQRFLNLKSEGGLSSPQAAAAEIASIIADRHFGAEIIDDVRRLR
ncbi:MULTISPECIES: SDR family NAD(P)-dependent oxidoreductase [unclassified Neisseria]|uniref:SDR family NAD(P)-dependent oxidoreductase n=1 Tax=unclassified Neisseria TaxID=2623750 RepID=UPI0010721AF4|nr:MULTISPECIES: SDR family NAD(P)-dependent oxidoreductase [unclassified Neisseria]MBF0803438.1 SDR family NAD(P)-dependent oxidoreductase [Neisseria sp. 19428wB4_WF04]TFU43839.1 SDR family NAD(P)-dependent oxidoreductase [Neisseria sp. WF04]